MKGRINLGIRTFVKRADLCTWVCTRGVQGIRPGVLRTMGSIGCGSQVGTAHLRLYGPPQRASEFRPQWQDLGSFGPAELAPQISRELI